MAQFTLAEIARHSGGRILHGLPETIVRSYGIDSRETLPGSLFFALRGKRDGHDFVPTAAENGAAAAVVSRPVSIMDGTFGLVLVGDTLAALQNLAAAVLRGRKAKVVGITGSIGKTTTKEFASALLSSRFRTLKSEGNLNNHLGLPLSLLKLEDGHEVVVLEMGMSAPGEIRTLTGIAPPDVAVITNVEPVHLEFFGSLDEIALAKKEILDGANMGATAVLNGDDPRVRKMAKGWSGPRITFGRAETNDVRAHAIRPRGLEGTDFVLEIGTDKAEVTFPFINGALVMNLLAAAAAAHACGVPLQEMAARIAALEPLSGRGILVRLPNGIRLYDDSYNSNPRALEAVLDSLAERSSSRKIAVLGDMLELGANQREFHRQAGETVARLKWDVLVAVGALAGDMADGASAAGMENGSVFAFPDSATAAKRVAGLLRDGDLVLVKGSRGVKMEEIVLSLKAEETR